MEHRDIQDDGSATGNITTISTQNYLGQVNKGLELDETLKEKNITNYGSTPDIVSDKHSLHDNAEYKGGWGLRHVFSFLAFTALTVSYMNRNNLNIAIVAMVASSNSSNLEEGDVCPLRGNSSDSQDDSPPGEFYWDEETQGMLMGCFFYGYTAGNFLGGIAAEYLGGRIALGVSVIATSILGIISPICVRTSLGLFIAVRVLSGFAQGPLYPAIVSLMATWIPAREKASLSSFIFPGNHMGTVISMSLGGVMASSDFLGGWPSLFYVFGIIGLLWSIAWFVLVRDLPEKHPYISSAELEYIRANSSTVKTAQKMNIPWKDIITSMPFLCLIVFSFGDGIGFFTLLTEIPTYLKNIQHFDLASNGLLSALPYLCVIIFSPIYGTFMSMMSRKGIMTVKSVRKVSTGIGLYTSCASLVAMCFVNCNATLAIVFLCLAVGINGAKYCGALVSEQDIAPNLAGVLKGIVNTVAGITGIIAPLITGAITSGNQTLSAWRTVFIISAVTYFIGATVFLIFGTDKVQPWNEPKQKKDCHIYISFLCISEVTKY